MIEVDQPGFYAKGAVGEESAEHYLRQGFMVVHDAVGRGEVEALRSEAVAVCRGVRGELATSFRNKAQEAAFPSLDALRTMPEEEAIRHFLCIHQAHKRKDSGGSW